MAQKSGFHDPIAVKKTQPKEKPSGGVNTPWNFTAPCYDERTSCFVDAGTHYGVGHRQPVGREGDPSSKASCLPFGHPQTMSIIPKRTNEKI
jgi:hypothetical protein